MGFFTPKKTISVSSVVYNLAGDVDDRADFLKTAVVGGVIGKQSLGIAETLRESYLNGPGIKLRSFARWARLHGYSHTVGQNASTLRIGNSLNRDVLTTQIPRDWGQTVSLQTAEIGVADYAYWAAQYMSLNHPELMDTAWTADFNETANEITVVSSAGTEAFSPSDFDPNSRYILARYTVVDPESLGAVTTGTTITLGSGAPFPAHGSGAVALYYTNTSMPITLTTTVTTDIYYTDATPSSSTVVATHTADTTENMVAGWQYDVFMGATPTGDGLYSIRYTQHELQVEFESSSFTSTSSAETLSGGVIKTTNVYTNTDFKVTDRSYQIDEQEVIHKKWSNMMVFIYREGAGNSTLDAMFSTPSNSGAFFPYIPLRLNNQFIDNGGWVDLHEGAIKALKRGTGTTFPKLRQLINDNPSIGDIDYAYVVYGVALNTKENASRRYIYEFFQEIFLGLTSPGSEFDAWQDQWADAQASWNVWNTWKATQTNPSDPLFDTPEPTKLAYPEPPYYSIDVNSEGHPGVDYSMHIEWYGMKESVHTGSAHSQGDVWFDNLGDTAYDYDMYNNGVSSVWTVNVNTLRINLQQSPTTYRTLEVSGLSHRNLIYGGKSVDISASEALGDAEESGFIIPLHEEIFRRTQLVQATQMSTACCYIVFNCYTVSKEKWYQTSWFKVILVIAIIIITVVTGGSGAGSIGLLGANGAVGSAFGLSGTAAVIAGAIANAVAAMIVVQIVTTAGKAIFGDKIGQIVGLVASFVAINVGTSFVAGDGIALNFADLLKPENLLKLSMSAGDGYAGYIQAQTAEKIQETQQFTTQAEAEILDIQKMSEQLFGQGRGGVLDPFTLTDIGQTLLAETRDSFLNRTLLVGSDISEMSIDMLTRFAEITLSTELPT